jgi:hypothetical protein
VGRTPAAARAFPWGCSGHGGGAGHDRSLGKPGVCSGPSLHAGRRAGRGRCGERRCRPCGRSARGCRRADGLAASHVCSPRRPPRAAAPPARGGRARVGADAPASRGARGRTPTNGRAAAVRSSHSPVSLPERVDPAAMPVMAATLTCFAALRDGRGPVAVPAAGEQRRRNGHQPAQHAHRARSGVGLGVRPVAASGSRPMRRAALSPLWAIGTWRPAAASPTRGMSPYIASYSPARTR